MDQYAGLLFTIALDIQLMLGLLLYFVFSDLTRTAFTNISFALDNPTLQFFSIYHGLLMGIAISIAHLVRSFGNKEIREIEKYKRTTIPYTVAFSLLALAIPWTTRPLLPKF